jgi:WD40 repeat protein
VAWQPQGNSLATGHKDGTIAIWDVDGRFVKRLLGHDAGIKNLDWSPQGDILASSAHDKTIRLWRPDEAGQPIVIPTDHALAIAWSPTATR